MNLVRIKNFGDFRVKKKTRLLDFLIEKGVPIVATCGGRGRCGHCRVRIKGKKIRPPDEIEKILISKKLLNSGYRLACRYYIDQDIELSIPRPKTKMARVIGGYGLALDLGTTVIKGAMVDLMRGVIVKKVSVYNPQNSMGGDVITRIGYAIGGRYPALRRLLYSGIDMVGEKIGLIKPLFTTVVGNPVMLSFFLNKPVGGLAGYPFKPAIKEGLFLKRPPRYVFPIIGGFVGGDTIAGILSSGLIERAVHSLYIDLGTNGEVVLIKKNKIIAASTAAGPAFEGIGITGGSLAVPGAIERVWFQKGLRYHTIGNKKPVGICASGLIDLLAVMLEIGWLRDDGRLVRKIGVGGIRIKQEDVRRLQLAIGAVHTGIEILLDKFQVRPSVIGNIVLTGEFGSNLNLESLKKVGILPKGVKRVRFENDLPLKGAVEVLVNDMVIKKVDRIESIAQHLELAVQPQFQEKFVKALGLKPWP